MLDCEGCVCVCVFFLFTWRFGGHQVVVRNLVLNDLVANEYLREGKKKSDLVAT
jgi:hypothetical protein